MWEISPLVAAFATVINIWAGTSKEYRWAAAGNQLGVPEPKDGPLVKAALAIGIFGGSAVTMIYAYQLIANNFDSMAGGVVAALVALYGCAFVSKRRAFKAFNAAAIESLAQVVPRHDGRQR